MKMVRSTVLIFAVLLLAAIANAQYAPQGMPMGQPYPGQMSSPLGMPQIIPVPNSAQNYYSIPPMMMPQSNTPFFPQSTMPMPSMPYNNSNDTYNPYSITPFNYSSPFEYNPYGGTSYDSNPWGASDGNYRSSEDEEDRREKQEEREEAREEKRRQREEDRQQEREDRRREARGERSGRASGGAAADGDSKPAKPNLPFPNLADPQPQKLQSQVASPTAPVAGAAAQAKATDAKSADGKTTAPAAITAGVAAKPATSKPLETKVFAAPTKVSAPVTAAAAVTASAPVSAPRPAPKAWWETSPEYQKYLVEKKANEKAAADWPPKAKPVTQQTSVAASAPALAPQVADAPPTGKLAATADCETCDKKTGPLTKQVEAISNLAKPPYKKVSATPDSRVGEGIRRVINTLYQSCEAYDKWLYPYYCQEGFVGAGEYCHRDHARKAGDLTAYTNPNEFFSYEIASKPGSDAMIPESPEGPQCRDMNKTPPVFRFDGRPIISSAGKGKVKLNLFNESKSGGKFVTMGCSGFVTAAYSAAGLNFAPNSPTQQVTTASLHHGDAKCLKTPTLSSTKSISSGDIVLFAEHSFILDQVGADPFGLEDIPALPAGASAAQHCINNLKPTNFSFVVVQSGVYGGRVAVSQARATDYFYNTGEDTYDEVQKKLLTNDPNLETKAQFLQIAVDACVAKLTGATKPAAHAGGATILRHKGSAAPGCVRPSPPEIVGQECVKGCT